ncbi:transformer-sr ribonucleoprotein [Ophiostoma piceae UAMH 11346]|uniref:Transformer-sr ribonucleoprotein n=1 Tax=Ophiostoma piceae (strain UAMH 11346) TaxID=1262450 RepID=S3CBW7_OPHP1|nr:transformer-sr ribonucleoprotein [Ophiostoma piceae UAMH 11346]
MASTAMDYEPTSGERFDDDGARYERDEQRSASPRRDEGQESAPRRSASPGTAGDRPNKGDNDSRNGGGDDDGAINPGSNLFVTGIHPRLSEAEVTRLFEKYGEVEKCQIMRDPHSKESRGFGFVKMVTSDQADAAKDGLQGEVIDGRSLSIEKARRARPRTPTPGKYFGPPKRDPRGGGSVGGGGGRFDRFDDRRRGGERGGYGGGGGYGRDDPYRYRGYERRYEDRGGYDRGYREERGGYDRGYDRGYERGDRGGDRGGFREDRGGYERRDRDEPYSGSNGGSRGGDRYGPREDRDRYGGPREERRGGGGGGGGGGSYERTAERDAPRSREPAPGGPSGYSEGAPRERDYSQRT